MPQMAPLYWFWHMVIFVTLLSFFSSFIYFMPKVIEAVTKPSTTLNHKIWSW